MVETGINKGVCHLMWPAALSIGLVALGCGHMVLWRNLSTFKKQKQTKKKKKQKSIAI